MDTFRVAFSGDFLKPDGSPAHTSFDLSPLEKDPNIEYTYLPKKKVVQAEDIAGFDALILLSARFERESFPADGTLSIIARFGVGFDTVDVPACTDNSVALVTTPDGVRRARSGGNYHADVGAFRQANAERSHHPEKP